MKFIHLTNADQTQWLIKPSSVLLVEARTTSPAEARLKLTISIGEDVSPKEIVFERQAALIALETLKAYDFPNP